MIFIIQSEIEYEKKFEIEKDTNEKGTAFLQSLQIKIA